ncbi:MAG: M42 family metallopeptidase [Anaerolineae bacterium]|nr:M42 family metallopeptidase [Anaerolineae bacterium]
MKILKQLSESIGVSGAEVEVRDLILKLIKPHIDDIKTDTIGNIIATRKGTGESKLKVMLDAHMDEVGLMVIGHDSNGMLRVAAIGGIDDRILLGKRVLVGPKKLPGVIGAKPIHLLDNDEFESVVKIDALRVDIGAESKKSAEKKAPLGTRIAFDTRYADLGKMARGKAFDDRVGCAVLVHVLQSERLPFDLIGAFTVQEEVGVRGAKIAAYTVNPDLAVVLEGTIADDLPKEDDVSPVTKPGKGPALSIMDRSTIYDARLNRWLTETAELLNLSIQIKQPGIGGTDGSAIHLSREGIPTVAVSVPCRYIHSPAAMLNKRDYQNTIKLVRAALERLDGSILRR